MLLCTKHKASSSPDNPTQTNKRCVKFTGLYRAAGIGRPEAIDYIERFVAVPGGPNGGDGEVERGRAAWAFRYRLSEDELSAVADAVTEAIQAFPLPSRLPAPQHFLHPAQCARSFRRPKSSKCARAHLPLLIAALRRHRRDVTRAARQRSRPPSISACQRDSQQQWPSDARRTEMSCFLSALRALARACDAAGGRHSVRLRCSLRPCD